MREVALLAPLLLVACAAAPAPAPVVIDQSGTIPVRGAGQCRDVEPGRFVGQIANPPTGEQILAATGAKFIRWVSPGMAVTMDFRDDRVTVHYDENRKILTVSCG